MDKVNFKNSRNLNLIGNFYPTDSNSVIIMTHGFGGDKSEWGRFNKTAEALNKEGYNVLTFDFSGSGESDDDPLTANKWIDDLNSAIKFILDKELTNIGLIGLSLGGFISAKIYDEKIKTMVLWAPVTSAIDLINKYTPEQLRELEETGFITKIQEEGIRKKIIIDKQVFEDKKNINQEELLSRIKCPILIIHGNKDEAVPLEDSRSAMKYLPSESKLEVIEGADHDFSEYLDTFIKLTINWFKRYL